MRLLIAFAAAVMLTVALPVAAQPDGVSASTGAAYPEICSGPQGCHVSLAGRDCPQFFAGGVPPRILSMEICYHGYALGNDPGKRDPLWSAEHLTADGVAAALAAKRAGDFHPEPLLPKANRAKPEDYDCEPFDRGHMSPAGDFGVAAEEFDSFSMANMVPQDPELNEGLWAGFEGAVRELARTDGELYVVTGPAFGANPGLLKGRVAIPAATWKAIYDPKTGATEAIVAANDASGNWRVSSIADLAQLIGFDPMPGVAATAKAEAWPMIAPTKGNSVLKPRTCTAH